MHPGINSIKVFLYNISRFFLNTFSVVSFFALFFCNRVAAEFEHCLNRKAGFWFFLSMFFHLDKYTLTFLVLRVIEWVNLYLLEHASKNFQTKIFLVS